IRTVNPAGVFTSATAWPAVRKPAISSRSPWTRGRAGRTSFGRSSQLTENLYFRQRPAEILDAGVGDFRTVKAQFPKVRQCFEVDEALVGDALATQREFLQAGHVFQIRQTVIAHLRAIKPQLLESDQSLEVHQPGIADRGVVEIERREAG